MSKQLSLFKNIVQDVSLSAINAGFITVLVGFTSSVVIVFQAAYALGASPQQISSWILALGVGMGVTGIALSIRYKTPITTAWSTSGAAMLVSTTSTVNLNEAIGAFIMTGILISLSGFSGLFERVMKKIPLSIAAAMLSGVLINFGVDAFSAMKSDLFLVLTMFIVFIITQKYSPRYAVIYTLLIGCMIAYQQGLIEPAAIEFSITTPVFTMPVFSLQAFIGITVPLFVVTMASQNLPGLTVLRASDYKDTPVSPLIAWTGVSTTLLAAFGAYTINLATITSAICVGKEAHTDPKKRYIAAIAAGFFYIVTGLFGTAVVQAFTLFPQSLILAIAGLALIGTIGNALASAVIDERNRQAALITFLITASGISFLSIGSAFWGIIAGAFTLLINTPQPIVAMFTKLLKK
ncbi:benzoate/H(+) symporter BenE family transporter [Pseudoalteromonas sp. NEC-BIFX-2020_015]|uniref:benzoate/H(+) symporter BenE family transporter n=1 Tax=Pseudoalteromonas sp. NEC-BIFX-2020_015 TaxID=2729544 RepID=UPI0014614891|nr:benzoate/H(+) symporter BenE family transporter [Pseudoalteromonas sp. NEC-BIFX-2020_015]NMR24822.1 benzoate/H(+) symporter BenE family transporter [Pseudoalteromonas sp. NEC-BIFX-2020_015]